MLYQGNAQKHKGNLASEYRQVETHNHVNKEQPQEDNNTMASKRHFTKTEGNKEINITVVFPNRSDEKAEQEFIGSLKELYLKKLESESMQNDSVALKFPATKEGKRYE